MARTGWKRWIVALAADDSQLLEKWAADQERCPDQQATFIIRCALRQIRVAEVPFGALSLPEAEAGVHRPNPTDEAFRHASAS